MNRFVGKCLKQEFLSFQRNISYSVKGIGTGGMKILYSCSFPKSAISLAITYEVVLVSA